MSGNKEFKNLLIVIPTRNRADFAFRAARSVLEQKNCNCRVLISDNSTDQEELQKLSAFCEQANDDRLKYIRPTTPLPMTQHWDWAMTQAMEIFDFSHVGYLSDRTVFLDGRLKTLEKILIDYSDKIVSFCIDSINDKENPVLLGEAIRTDQLFEIDSSFILQFYAGMERFQALPKMVNSIAPRIVMEEIKRKMGSYFSSIAPDYNFAYASLEIVDSILFYDSPVVLAYGLARSSGMNVLSGNFQKDSLDFIKNLTSEDVCFETPIKSILVLPNAVIHEYCFIQQNSSSNKFPEINQKKYLKSLVENIDSYQNEEMKQEMLKKLRSELGFDLIKYRFQAIAERKLKGLKVKWHNLTNSSSPYLLLKRFENVEDAIKYASESPRKPANDYKLIEDRMGIKPSKNGPIRLVKKISAGSE